MAYILYHVNSFFNSNLLTKNRQSLAFGHKHIHVQMR